MESLRTYLNSLSSAQQQQFASKCGTSLNYLRVAISANKKLGGNLVINIERESNGVVRCEQLRPDCDWKFVRQTG